MYYINSYTLDQGIDHSRTFTRKANTTDELRRLCEHAVMLDIAIVIRFTGTLRLSKVTGKPLTKAQIEYRYAEGAEDDIQLVHYYRDMNAFVWSVPQKYPKVKVNIRGLIDSVPQPVVKHWMPTIDQEGILTTPDPVRSSGARHTFEVDFLPDFPFTDSAIDTTEWLDGAIPFSK